MKLLNLVVIILLTIANYWMHNGFVTINKEKCQNRGNIITISDAVKKYSGQVVN